MVSTELKMEINILKQKRKRELQYEFTLKIVMNEDRTTKRRDVIGKVHNKSLLINRFSGQI